MHKNPMPVIWLLAYLLFRSLFTEGQPPRGPLVVSPEIHGDKAVTFRYLAPSAKDVKLSAQFLKSPVPMTKDSAGIWSITVAPVQPDIYPYSFNVDGITVMDPANVDFFPNERFKASLVDVHADTPLIHSLRDVPHGTMTYEYYPSLEVTIYYIMSHATNSIITGKSKGFFGKELVFHPVPQIAGQRHLQLNKT